MVDKRFIVNLQGKEFVTYEGLLDTAHKMGLQGIKTELIELPSSGNQNRCIMKATAYTDKGQYEGYGDADSTNVNRMIARHVIRMAETRAKARALRDLTNIGMTALEELGGEEETTTQKSSTSNTNQPKNKSDKHACVDCGQEINQAVYTFSTNKLGKALCRDCQSKYKS